MTLELIQEEVNIYEYPSVDEKHKVPGAEFTMGDMHGNAIKFIFMLIKQGVVSNISKEEYEKLLSIYNRPNDDLTKNDLQEFQTIIDKMAVNTDCFVRLIGDELGDRGKNDYFTLVLLKKLHQERLPIEILLSNHGADFINRFANKEDFIPRIHSTQITSLHNIIALIQKGLITEKEVKDIIRDAYKPYLKAITYSFNEDRTEISIYSHAPINIEKIKLLAEQFNVQFADKTPEQLAKTIDAINTEFKKHVDADTVSQQILVHSQTQMNPLAYSIWNRDEEIQRAKKYKGYSVSYVHGHTGAEGYYKSMKYIINLNNLLGQRYHYNTGNYSLAFQISPRLIDGLLAQISNEDDFKSICANRSDISDKKNNFLIMAENYIRNFNNDNQTLKDYLVEFLNQDLNHIRMIMLSVISEEHKELQLTLKEILNKTEQFGDSYKKYGDAAKELFDTIIQNYASISRGKLKKEEFFQNCNTAIHKALVILDKNRDTLPKIINLIAQITILPALLKKLFTGQWNIFQTESSQKVQNLQEKLQSSIFNDSDTSNNEKEVQRLIIKKQ